MIANGFESYEIAKNDLEEIKSDLEEEERKERKAIKNTCEHELIEVTQTRKGGIRVVDHHRCIKCGYIPEIGY